MLVLAELAQPAGEGALEPVALGGGDDDDTVVAATANQSLERGRAERLGELLGVVDHHDSPVRSSDASRATRLLAGLDAGRGARPGARRR